MPHPPSLSENPSSIINYCNALSSDDCRSLTQSVVYELVQPMGDGGKAGGEILVDNPAYLGRKDPVLSNAGYEPVIPRSNDSAF